MNRCVSHPFMVSCTIDRATLRLSHIGTQFTMNGTMMVSLTLFTVRIATARTLEHGISARQTCLMPPMAFPSHRRARRGHRLPRLKIASRARRHLLLNILPLPQPQLAQALYSPPQPSAERTRGCSGTRRAPPGRSFVQRVC